MLRKRLRKPRSFWVMNGRTDDWWIKMLTEDIPDTILEKNLLYEQSNIFRIGRNSKTNDEARYELPELSIFINGEKNCSRFVLLERRDRCR